MRLVRAPLVLLVVASFPAAACSLIVQFHDQSTGGGDDASVVESGPAPEAATQDSGVLQDSSGGDSMAAIDTFAPCLGKANGFYCGNNGLGPGLPPEDIVHCINDGSVGTAISCGDAGCLHVVDPFPDACNPCFGVADGAYCGRDLAGFPAYSADILLQCTSGSTTQQTACAAGCHSIGTMSVCY
jgi:hypothetical protein